MSRLDEFTRGELENEGVEDEFEERGYVRIAGDDYSMEEAYELWEIEGELEPDVYDVIDS